MSDLISWTKISHFYSDFRKSYFGGGKFLASGALVNKQLFGSNNKCIKKMIYKFPHEVIEKFGYML